MNLLESTRQLLKSRRARGVSFQEIVDASDGTVGLEWLYRFARDEIENPGIKTIQSLHTSLKSIRAKSAA